MKAGREMTSWLLLRVMHMQLDASPVARRSSEIGLFATPDVCAEAVMKRLQYVIAIRVLLGILLVLRAGRRKTSRTRKRNGLKDGCARHTYLLYLSFEKGSTQRALLHLCGVAVMYTTCLWYNLKRAWKSSRVGNTVRPTMGPSQAIGLESFFACRSVTGCLRRRA